MSTAIAAARAKTRGKRMLREALEGYGEDEFTLSEWNAKKKEAAAQGKWTWKQRLVDPNQAIKARIEKHGDVQDILKDRFVDISSAMQQEIREVSRGPGVPQQHGARAPDCCEWSERICGKRYRCTNAPVPVKGTRRRDETDDTVSEAQTELAEPSSGTNAASATTEKRLCFWHVCECQWKHHPMEHSRAIDTANDQGMCLHCYESTAATERKTLQRVPPRITSVKTPGVCLSDEKGSVRREMLYKAPRPGTAAGGPSAIRLTASSTCCWQKEHFERAYLWRCMNHVLMHPTLRGSYLPFCGYHAPRCIRDYGRKRTGNKAKEENCPPIDRRNQFGMCRNHLEAQLSELKFDERGAVVLADSEFDVPGIKECKKEATAVQVQRHPLAPLYPPPIAGIQGSSEDSTGVTVLSRPEPPTSILAVASTFIVKVAAMVLSAVAVSLSRVLNALLNHSNPASAFIKEAIWRFQFMRRAGVVATRIQRIFRGNRARRRARSIRYEAAALRRIAASRAIQRVIRGFLGRRRFIHEADRVAAAVPHMQRLLRGGLARLHCRRLRAAIRLQRNYRWYRQRLLAWSFREEVAYMQLLQRESDANLRTLEQQLAAFRRIRARRVLRGHVERWRHRKETRQREAARRIQTLLGTIKIQRQWRRHCRFLEIKRRYVGAQQIQKRVRGWLTRHMWRNDPGVLVIVGYVNSRTAFEYGKTVVLPLRQGKQLMGSYAFPTRRIRMKCGAAVIQRVFRGHLGRLRGNAMWAAMLKRWEWIGMSPDSGSGNSSDSMTLGKERYGFVLPSYGYHWDSRQHMRLVVRDAVVDRGHAYKYQFILDLIKDRDGKRAWSMARERRWLHDHGKRRMKEAQEAKSSVTGTSPRRLRRQVAPAGSDVPLTKALFPTGTVVDVEQMGNNAAVRRTNLTRGPVTRRGRVIAVNAPLAVDQQPTFDIAYSQKERVERRVAASRVSHAIFGIDKPLPRPKKPAGEVIQAAIDSLKRDLEGKEERIRSATLPTNESSEDKTLPTIEAVAERLRDSRKGRDLLSDQRDWVNFVFRNADLLERRWLEAVDLVRQPPQSSNLFHGAPMLHQVRQSNHPSDHRMHPTLAMLCQEFGFQRSASDRDDCGLTKAAKRADEIERRLIELGFRRSSPAPAPFASEKAFVTNDEREDHLPRRPETGVGTTEVYTQPSRTTVDDLESANRYNTQSSQDIHRFIYELKTLPRQRQREKIIEVTTRNVRSFVCGHPACGRCFSSKEAARMHQKTTHEGQARLASAAALTDQYLHSYWPPQTPWTDRDTASGTMVGYFTCSQSDCRLQFRSRRELNRHLADAHGIESSSEESRITSQPLPTEQRKAPALDSTIMWLGPFVLCRSLGDKLAIPWSHFEPCALHATRSPDECASCRLLEQLPMQPCRCYVSVAISIPSGAQTLSGEEDEDGDEFAIITIDDRHCGVAVIASRVLLIRTRDGVPVKSERESDGKRRRASPQRSRERSSWTKINPSSDPEEVNFIQCLIVCRDDRNEPWVIGHPFISTERVEEDRPTKTTSSGRETFTDDEEERGHNVELDRSRIAVARLSAVIGTAVVLAASPADSVGELPDPEVPASSSLSRSAKNDGIRARRWRTFELICPSTHA